MIIITIIIIHSHSFVHRTCFQMKQSLIRYGYRIQGIPPQCIIRQWWTLASVSGTTVGTTRHSCNGSGSLVIVRQSRKYGDWRTITNANASAKIPNRNSFNTSSKIPYYITTKAHLSTSASAATQKVPISHSEESGEHFTIGNETSHITSDNITPHASTSQDSIHLPNQTPSAAKNEFTSNPTSVPVSGISNTESTEEVTHESQHSHSPLASDPTFIESTRLTEPSTEGVEGTSSASSSSASSSTNGDQYPFPEVDLGLLKYDSSRQAYLPPFPIPTRYTVIADPGFIVADALDCCPNPYFMRAHDQMEVDEFNVEARKQSRALPINIAPSETGVGELSVIIRRADSNFIAPTQLRMRQILETRTRDIEYPQPLPAPYFKLSDRHEQEYTSEDPLEFSLRSRLFHVMIIIITISTLGYTLLEGDVKTPTGKDHIFSGIRRHWKVFKLEILDITEEPSIEKQNI